MSNPLNGGVRSHAGISSFPFNSVKALSASADQYGLSNLVSALASNDPKRVSECGESLAACLRDAESIIRLGCDFLRLAAENKDAHLLSTHRDADLALYAAAGIVSLCAEAILEVEDAEAIVRGGRHE